VGEHYTPYAHCVKFLFYLGAIRCGIPIANGDRLPLELCYIYYVKQRVVVRRIRCRLFLGL